MSKIRSSAPPMLSWQYKNLLACLGQITLHASDDSCPCNQVHLGDGGKYNAEYCLGKHLIDFWSLCLETALMDSPNKDILETMATEADGFVEKAKTIYCKGGTWPDLAQWSRDCRKKLEPIFYSCSTKAPMHQEPMVKISGKCQGDKACTIKVTATEGTSKESSIGGLGEAIESVLREMNQRKVKPASPLTFAVGPTTLTKYELENVLVEAEDLIVSHNPVTFEPNAEYPAELQPRLRGRQANRSQVQQIAKNLDADVLLTDYHSIDRGAPIIGHDDSVVESGNGRTMAIQLAIVEFPESYAKYRAELIARAASLGLSEDQAKAMTHPVVARKRLTDVPRRQFVEEANASTTLAPSAIEIARSDASHITSQMVSQLWVGDDQGIEDALRSLSNGEFVGVFLGTVAANERAQITDARGQLNQDGIRRMVMALFVNAFPGDSGLRLAEKFFESTEPTVRNVFNGIAQALGKLAKSEALCRSGDRDPDLAVGEDLAAAVVAFADIKKTPGMTVPNYLNQAQMFERRLNQFQETLLKLIDERSKSGKKIGQLLKSYAVIVAESPPPSQGSLLPSPRVTKDEVLQAAVKRATSDEQSTQLFQQPKLTTHCNALVVANKELGRIIKTLAHTRITLGKAQDKLGPSLNICGGQSTMFQQRRKPPKLTISGKCGESVETCHFTIKREGEKIKANSIDEVIGALDKLSKKCVCKQETKMKQKAEMEICLPCLMLASGKVSTKEYQTGDEIYYTGDMANVSDTGIIIKVRPPTKYGPLSYDIHLRDGREMKGIAWMSFEPGPGQRFYLLREWEQEQDRKLQELKEQYLRTQAHVESRGSLKKVCTPAQMVKREDCIQDMKATNREIGCKSEGTGSTRCPSPFAVCTKVVNCRPGRASEKEAEWSLEREEARIHRPQEAERSARRASERN